MKFFAKSPGCIIGFENILDLFDKADLCSEFFDEKKSSIGGKITSIQNFFNLLITSEPKVVRIVHGEPFFVILILF